MDKNIKISVVIPTYEARGMGVAFLKQNLEALKAQTFKDFEVIVSDNSKYFIQEQIEWLCARYPFVKYYRNDKRVGLVQNLNYAMSLARGELIKIIFQDDFLFHENALQDIVDNFKGNWMVTASESTNDGKNFNRPFYPKYTEGMHLGINTISSPSVLTIRNEGHLLFDENVIMLMDVCYYKDCYDKFGEPTILNKINVANTVGNHQVSRNITQNQLDEEIEYSRNKYK